MKQDTSFRNRQWLLAQYAPEQLAEGNFAYHESELERRPLADGEILVRNKLISLGPSTRGRLTGIMHSRVLPSIELGTAITSITEAEVVDSANPAFPVGTHVWGMAAWEDYSYVNPALAQTFAVPNELAGRKEPLHFNMLTAYFGLTEIGNPKPGETLVVSGAAGSVGFMAAQYGRALGCRVIGIAGGREKQQALLDQGRLDAAIDYRNEDVEQRLVELCPDGIDIYFDNVGDDVIDTVVENMNVDARVVVSGQIARYDARGRGVGLRNFSPLVSNRIRMEGFVVFDYANSFETALRTIADWIDRGEIVNRLDVRQGFNALPSAFIDLFEGGNRGALLVHIE